ncbi:Ribonuclease P/MRP protein subunit POP5 [Rhynchospora pubera]|uniref:Ribonuclease P/MRP protein subunit POP5 n=1 Tax=Rhynchospora pubera TaxID=906938 RepID=A0AAV8BY91_9POAL|nr:Ribonuclease P/MRP protein subunit POP5 [Rhynchospora pubera]
MVQFKNRYLVMEVLVDPNHETGDADPIVLSGFNVTKAIKDSIQLNFGECGLASSLLSFQVKYVNPITKICIIRVSRDDHKKIWAAITMVRSIGRCPVSFNQLDLSGCIQVCRTKALECDETKFEQYKLLYGDRVTPEIEKSVKNNFERIKALEN